MPQQAIEAWLGRIVSEGPTSYCKDLHIDDVDEQYSDRAQWVSGALACAELAARVRDSRSLQWRIAVGLGLRPGPVPTGVSFADWAGVLAELDDAPPSLYTWPINTDPLGIGGTQVTDLSGFLEVPFAYELRLMLSEWHNDTDAEFRRTLWLLSP